MDDIKINGYELSRDWFDFCFENPELITPTHTALYFFGIEHCNRLGWKEKFGLPTQMAMDAIGVKNWRTFSKAFNDITEWGFFRLVSKSKNQYSATVIAIVKNTRPNTKALTKAMQKHLQKQSSSIVVIDKLLTIEPNNQKTTSEYDFIAPEFKDIFDTWLEYKKEKKESYKSQRSIKACYESLLFLSSKSPEVAKKIVNQSMANNWKGLFELKGSLPNNKTTNGQPKLSI